MLARKGLLEKYHNYIKSNPQSMLARFYGIYTIKIKFMKPINVIIMDNVMGKHSEDIVRVFDLKGSTYGRRTVPVSSFGKFDHTMALKDLDFLDRKEKFRIGEHNKRRLLEIIRNDC